MRNNEWPGVATAVGALLLVAIALDLNKWQPILAALIAISGGYLAYRGAMAKVYADHDRERRDLDRKRLGVFLRAEHACDLLSARAETLSRKTNRFDQTDREVHVDELRITDIPDLAEAWANLELFPSNVALILSQIQASVRTLDKFLATLPPDTKWTIGAGRVYTVHMKVTTDVADTLVLAANDFRQKLLPSINELAARNVDF